MDFSSHFRPIDYKYVDHTIYGGKEIIQFRVPSLKLENIHLTRGDGWSPGCPSYLSAELSIPADSPYTFQELGVYFRLTKEGSEKISLWAIPYAPYSISNPKRAKFFVTFNLEKELLNFLDPFKVEVFAIDNRAEIGKSSFANVKLL